MGAATNAKPAFDPSTAVPAEEFTNPYAPAADGFVNPFDPSAAQPFDDLIPRRGPLSEIGVAAKRGLFQGIQGAGAVLQAPAEQAHQEPGIISPGRSIESERDRRLSKEERIGPNTSAVAQLAGRAGLLSPRQIDFAVSAFLGWAGIHAVATADLALRPAFGFPNKPTPTVSDYFAVGDFVKSLPQEHSRLADQFYDHLRTVQEHFNDLRLYQQTWQMEKAAEALKENRNDIGLHGMYIRTEREIGKLNQRERRISMRSEASTRSEAGMSSDQKRVELDRLSQLKNRLTEAAETIRAKQLGSSAP